MITVSDDFKDEVFLNDNRSFLYRAVITLASGSSITVDNDDLALTGGVVIDEAVCSDENLRVGTCVVNKLTLTLQNYNGDFDAYNFMGAPVVLHIRLMVDGSLEEFQRGVYYVAESPVYDTAFLTLVCYDGMIACDAQYTDVQATFPITVDNLIGAICTACSVTRESQTLPLASLSIPANPFSETATCREVLSYIAEINGMNCRFNNLGKLEFTWYNDGFTGETIRGRATESGAVREVADNVVRITYRNVTGEVNWNNQIPIPAIYSLDVAKHDIVVTGIRIVIKTADETDKIDTYETGTADYLISVEGNPLVTASNASSVLATLATNLLGFRYRKAMLSHAGMPWMMAGDSGLITDAKGVQRDIIISATTFTAHDRQSTVSAGKSPVTAIQYTPETRAYMEQMENIKPVVNSINSRIANANGLYETQQTTQGGATITYMHNKPLLAESDIQIMISDVGVMVTANGTAQSPTWYGLEVNGTLIASILNANGINADWIRTGALVIYDDNNNELFRADKTNKVLKWDMTLSTLSKLGLLTFREDSPHASQMITHASLRVLNNYYHDTLGDFATELYATNGLLTGNVLRWDSITVDGETILLPVYKAWGRYGQSSINIIDNSGSSQHTVFSVEENKNTSTFRLHGSKMMLNERTLEEWIYKGAVIISSNSDVDQYDEPGNYLCMNGTVAGTLTHPPFNNSSFQMLCYQYTSSNQRLQVAWQNATGTTIRYRARTDGGTWGGWQHIATQKNPTFTVNSTNFTQTRAAITKAGRIVAVSLVLATKVAMSTGTTYTVGTVSDASSIVAPLYGKDGSQNVQNTYISTGSGNTANTLYVRPNVAIASGGVLEITGTYIASS